MRERSEMILADLIQIRAEQQPDLDVLTFEHLSLDGLATPDEVRTYADLQTNANRIAAGLAAKGVGKGDRIAIMMRNHPEFPECMIACSILGALFVPVDPRTKGDKLAYVLDNSGSVGLICADYCLGEVAGIRQKASKLKWILGVDSGEKAPAIADSAGVEALAEFLAQEAETLDVNVDSPMDPLNIMYTSGTTGDPKGIVGANFRFVAAGMLADVFGYGPDERPYTGLSFTHGNAQSVTLVPSLTKGLRGVFSRRFTRSKLWDVCRHYGCTTYSLVGGMAMAIYSNPERDDDAHNPVRMVVSGGMPAAIWESFEQRFDLRIFEFYGAMDGGGMAFKPVGEGPIGSFGKPMTGLEMKVLDEHDNECAPGVVGEICTRAAGGEAPPVEYHGNPEASKKKIKRGWNRSGDMGHRDADDWLFFDYRAGGGIRHNGDFINPSFVEKAIAESHEVADVFVYGVKSASQTPGEKDVVATIVFAEGHEGNVAGVFAACREKLESNFVPSYLQVVDEIPKTASEKPQERILLEQFAPDAANVHTQ